MLGNVSKMEESLRKLKKVRERQEARVEARPGLRWGNTVLTTPHLSPVFHLLPVTWYSPVT